MSRSTAIAAWLAFWAAASLAGAPQALADGVVRKAAAPGWAEDLPLPAMQSARQRQIKDGVYYLLLDKQIRPDVAGDTEYARSAQDVTDRSGLEDTARIEIDFDPSYQDVVLHYVRIWRGGVAHDQLPDLAVQVLQRETDLDNGVQDGHKTAHLEIKDLRVGDIVDYAYSLVSHEKLWPGQFFGAFDTNWSVPLALERYRLIWPTGRPLTIRNQNESYKPTLTQAGDRTFYDWRIKDADPVKSEDDAPGWYVAYGHITLSSLSSWKDVSALILPFFANKDALPPELETRVAKIMRDYRRPEDRVTEALRLVQDDLRYVSLSIGVGSFVPRNPTEVFRSGFGDCKDKSQLLVAMLRRMGMEAYVALAHSEKGPALPARAPAATSFDHAIVQLKLGGHTYWLDPTETHQGGRFPALTGLTYGWGLPLAPGKGLEPIPLPQTPSPTIISVEHYDLPDDPKAPLTLHVDTTYLGIDADWMRDNIASKSRAQIESDYLDFYAGLYPGVVRDRPTQFSNDRDANKIVVSEAYSLSAAALRKNGLIAKFEVKASSIDSFDSPPAAGRRAPYLIPFPINKRHIIVVHTPGHRPPMPQPLTVDGTAFHLDLATERSGDTITLDYRLTGKKQVLPPGEVNDYRKLSNDVDYDSYWYLDLTSNEGGYMDGRADRFRAWQGKIQSASQVLLAGLVVLGLAIFGVRRALHHDDAYAGTGAFYPVAIAKFTLMALSTAGLYPVFWFWKCWRWDRIHGGSPEVLPFWRAVFGVFWLYPLFERVNVRPARPVPEWIGIVGAALYILFAIAAAALRSAAHRPALALIVGLLAFVAVMPTVVAVNRANAGSRDIILANSQVTGSTLAAFALGALNWLFILAGIGAIQVSLPW